MNFLLILYPLNIKKKKKFTSDLYKFLSHFLTTIKEIYNEIEGWEQKK